MVDPTGGPGVAPHHTTDGQQEPLDRPVGAYRPQSISRTGRVVATRRARQRRDVALVAADHADQQGGQEPSHGQVPPTSCSTNGPIRACHRYAPVCVPGLCPSRERSRRIAESRSRPRSAPDAPPAAGRARTTRSVPGGRPTRCGASRWRSCLATRLRTTAGPTERPTTCQARAGRSDSDHRAWTTTVRAGARVPARITIRKSVDRRMRRGAGSTDDPDQAEMRVRPLPRRAARIPRPARVLIRARNPCVRARRRLFGWNVRFMGLILAGG